ncbi:hypothetical protein U6A24_21220 [Aquimarina gracilis]|uniref:Bacteriocin-like protein n=1 Tax=Aquimarina gracilis TaxID=874422 RepID=A0ABU6A1H2_9FLAO|nr:hypothetical protein [Aquimarina gracilis]MEB3348010.1 hypothetical protein [Aquimarina gracilis]
MKTKKKLSLKKMNISQLNNVKGGNINTGNNNTFTDMSDSLRIDCYPSGLTYQYCNNTIPVNSLPTVCGS